MKKKPVFLKHGAPPQHGPVVVSIPMGMNHAHQSVCGLKEFLIDQRREFVGRDGVTATVDCARVALLEITDSPVHRHSHTVEIYHILAGNGAMVLDEKVVEVEAGTIVLIPPGTEHGLFGREGRSLRVLISFTPGMAPVTHWEFRDEVILHESAAKRADVLLSRLVP